MLITFMLSRNHTYLSLIIRRFFSRKHIFFMQIIVLLTLCDYYNNTDSLQLHFFILLTIHLFLFDDEKT